MIFCWFKPIKIFVKLAALVSTSINIYDIPNQKHSNPLTLS
jgi:hypothetical protein